MSALITLEVTLFGTMRVQRGGQAVERFPSRRVKELFAYLILNRETRHPREYLSEVLWDGEEQDNPRRCLNTTLWRLHRALGDLPANSPPYVLADATQISFNTSSDCRVDVLEFEQRCRLAEQLGATGRSGGRTASPEAEAEQASLYEAAVALYSGDLLIDCYQDWCLTERERLQRLYRQALAWLMEFHTRLASHEAAINYGQRLLACDPLQEDVHQSLIRLYLASGQPSVAVRQFRDCESRLRRELGSEPAPESQQLVWEFFHRQRGHFDDRSKSAGRGAAPATDFAQAVGRLHTAITSFDSAQAELRRAAASVEGMALQLSAVLPAAQITRSATELERVSAQLVAW